MRCVFVLCAYVVMFLHIVNNVHVVPAVDSNIRLVYTLSLIGSLLPICYFYKADIGLAGK